MTVPEFLGLLALGGGTTALMVRWLDARMPGSGRLRGALVPVPRRRSTAGEHRS